MADAALTDSPTSRPQHFGPSRFSLALIVPWVLVGMLGISQIATLLNEQVHEVAFSALAAIARSAGPAIAETVLSRSPTHAKVRAVETATRKLQTEVTDVHARNRALQADVEAVKASKAALAREHDALRATSAKRAAAVRAVTARTSITLAGRAADAIKTLPVRAAPYVGIAAAVSFTALDLKADCDLARALAQLNDEHGNVPIDTGAICKAADQVPSPDQVWAAIRNSAGSVLRAAYGAMEDIAARAGLSIDGKRLP